MPIVSPRQGRSLELYFIDGRPDGMLTAEVFNWTGHVLMTPRSQIAEALRRKEAHYTGVYLLIGENDQGPLSYIGEGEVISDRIRSHDSKRNWWTKAVLITTGANNLNKAHIQYLEARLIGRVPQRSAAALNNRLQASGLFLKPLCIRAESRPLPCSWRVNLWCRQARALVKSGSANPSTPTANGSNAPCSLEVIYSPQSHIATVAFTMVFVGIP